MFACGTKHSSRSQLTQAIASCAGPSRLRSRFVWYVSIATIRA